MSRHNNFEERVFATGKRGFQIALEEWGERFLRLPFGMLRRECLYAIECEEQLNGHRLLTPERAVVVEGRDAFGDGHEVRWAFFGHLLDEFDDGLFGLPVVPRGQRVLRVSGGESGDSNRQQDKFITDGFHGLGIGERLTADYTNNANGEGIEKNDQ